MRSGYLFRGRKISRKIKISSTRKIRVIQYLEQTLQRGHRLSHMTEPRQSFLHQESVYWFYVRLFPDGNIFDVVFSCFSLYPAQHLHLCCVHLVLLTFSYLPTFPTICHCGSNCCFVGLVLHYFWEFHMADDTGHFPPESGL